MKYWRSLRQTGIRPANFATLAHFSVSTAMPLPNSAGELANTAAPRLAIRAFIVGSARPSLPKLSSEVQTCGADDGSEIG